MGRGYNGTRVTIGGGTKGRGIQWEGGKHYDGNTIGRYGGYDGAGAQCDGGTMGQKGTRIGI